MMLMGKKWTLSNKLQQDTGQIREDSQNSLELKTDFKKKLFLVTEEKREDFQNSLESETDFKKIV